jgi:hypothetical protein
MARERQSLVPRKAAARSRVSNGKEVLPGVDGRSRVGRRYFDISSQIATDLGGAERCAETKLQLIRRFAAASVLAEQLEARLANGERIDITEHALLSSTLVRIARHIGINRVAKNVVPDLKSYLRSRRQANNDDDNDIIDVEAAE